MTKYLALDVGNVVVDMKFDKFLNHLSTTLNISIQDAWSFLERTQKLHDLGYTMIRDEIRDHFKIRSEATVESIMKEWRGTLVAHPDVIAWAEKLLDAKVKIAFVSNMGYEHLQIIPSLLGDKLFNGCVPFFSAEVGARKPSLAFYHLFLSINPDFSGAVYLDDSEQNIAASTKFNLRPVLFDISKMDSRDTIKAKLQEVEELIFNS